MSETHIEEPGEGQPDLKCTTSIDAANGITCPTRCTAGNTSGEKSLISPVLLRLIEEVRREQGLDSRPSAYDRGYTRAIPTAPGKYDRTYNRHNR